MRRRFELVGCIAAAGFGPTPDERHRFVVGHWDATPIGPMADVMWTDPAGVRTLLADSSATASFVSAVYAFDRVEIVPFVVERTRRRIRLAAGDLRIDLRAGGPWALPPLWLRPAWVTRRIEAPIARSLMGVSAYGTSPSGVAEWYRATQVRVVRQATAAFAGRDLGPLGPVDPPLGSGFSEPPRFPSMVLVQPLLQDPSTQLDRTLDRIRSGIRV